MAEISRRVLSTLTNKVAVKGVALMLMVVPLVMPAGTFNQAQANDASTTVTTVVALKGLTADIVSVESAVISMPVAVAPIPVAKPKTTVAVAVQNGHYAPEPGPEGKRALVQEIAAAHGIDWKILEAVWQVESGKRWHTTVRSYAGAQGPCQFMPGTWRAYAADGNGDGIKDVTYAPDCLHGSAKLLAVNGAASGDVVRALLRYNNSMSYVYKVLSIAGSIAS
ncbi:MAG: lytic transglycosylase domain-containing protein [Patescibacteria group bacterium]